MPDIAKCWGRECPVKEKCFRFTAKPSERQTYFANPPMRDGKCDFFWGDTQESIMKQLEDIVNNQNKSDESL
jgi:hypothetical protein